ncbi:hypothetical protein ACQE8X_28175, partial [Klebsiella pneumoniae]
QHMLIDFMNKLGRFTWSNHKTLNTAIPCLQDGFAISQTHHHREKVGTAQPAQCVFVAVDLLDLPTPVGLHGLEPFLLNTDILLYDKQAHGGVVSENGK